MACVSLLFFFFLFVSSEKDLVTKCSFAGRASSADKQVGRETRGQRDAVSAAVRFTRVFKRVEFHTRGTLIQTRVKNNPVKGCTYVRIFCYSMVLHETREIYSLFQSLFLILCLFYERELKHLATTQYFAREFFFLIFFFFSPSQY